MKALDTNVLIHAHREEMGKHAEAHRLIRTFAEGSRPWALPIFCVGEFLRVVTHHRVFAPPTSLTDALAIMENLLQCPSLRLLVPSDRFWPIFSNTLQEGLATGNLVFDAEIVALCLDHGIETLVSEDRGLRRFQDLNIIPI